MARHHVARLKPAVQRARNDKQAQEDEEERIGEGSQHLQAVVAVGVGQRRGVLRVQHAHEAHHEPDAVEGVVEGVSDEA